MLRRISEHRELLELRVAGISHSSGADLLVHGLTSGRTADIGVRRAVGALNVRAAAEAGNLIGRPARPPGLKRRFGVAHPANANPARKEGQIASPVNPRCLAPETAIESPISGVTLESKDFCAWSRMLSADPLECLSGVPKLLSFCPGRAPAFLAAHRGGRSGAPAHLRGED